MGILFAKAMGCAVTAITSESSKISSLYELGVDEVRMKDKLHLSYTQSDGQSSQPQITDLPQPMSIDVLLITSNAIPDLSAYLGLLARRATIVLMTIQQDAISIPYMPFVLPGHRLIASTEASHKNHFDMLEFAARHKIEPVVEEYPMTLEGAAAAFERLETGKMRYRGVLVREAEPSTA
jgi:D-arabinose 1-dehydrogenase-like Zn-dependent alcohol dehydrogenase